MKNERIIVIVKKSRVNKKIRRIFNDKKRVNAKSLKYVSLYCFFSLIVFFFFFLIKLFLNFVRVLIVLISFIIVLKLVSLFLFSRKMLL